MHLGAPQTCAPRRRSAKSPCDGRVRVLCAPDADGRCAPAGAVYEALLAQACAWQAGSQCGSRATCARPPTRRPPPPAPPPRRRRPPSPPPPEPPDRRARRPARAAELRRPHIPTTRRPGRQVLEQPRAVCSRRTGAWATSTATTAGPTGAAANSSIFFSPLAVQAHTHTPHVPMSARAATSRPPRRRPPSPGAGTLCRRRRGPVRVHRDVRSAARELLCATPTGRRPDPFGLPATRRRRRPRRPRPRRRRLAAAALALAAAAGRRSDAAAATRPRRDRRERRVGLGCVSMNSAAPKVWAAKPTMNLVVLVAARPLRR